MSELPTYLDFKQKEEHFDLTIIENITEFNELAKLYKAKLGIFRGVNSSSYKILTSLQRAIIKDNLKESFIDNYINEFKNETILKNYFNTVNVNLSRFSIYSFLQHYGQPTPFLDFTKNFEIALYFAIEKFDQSQYTESKSINDYFSIFFIEQNDLEILSIKESMEELQKMKKSISNLSLKSNVVYEELQEMQLDLFETMLKLSIFDVHFIDHNNSIDLFNINNNIRIIAQEGVFIYNNCSDTPLEIALKKFLDGHTNFRMSVIEDDEIEGEKSINKEYERAEKYQQFQKRLDSNIIKSFEIKKILIPEIRQKYYLQKEAIYPEPVEICKKIFERAKNK
jgi:hypothetical protein